MSGLDFKRATDLFMGTERELAMALGIQPQELERFRKDPGLVPREVLARLANVLTERGRGMMRVGEILAEE